MIKLLIYRLHLSDIKKKLMSIIRYLYLFTVGIVFSLLLVMIYDNEVSQYYDSNYDYLVLNFDEMRMEEILSKPFVIDTYATRQIDCELVSDSNAVRTTVNLVNYSSKFRIMRLQETILCLNI